MWVPAGMPAIQRGRLDQVNIVVVGSANMDLVARVPRCPRPGESLLGESFVTVPGGKGANQAVAAARLGAEVAFIGCVGADAFGDALLASLNAEGIDTSRVVRHASVPTGIAMIQVDASGQNTIVVVPGANLELSRAHIEKSREVFEQADAMLIQLEIATEAIEAALDMARKTTTRSILDAGPPRDVPLELLAKADVISPNETETHALTGIDIHTVEDAKAAAATLRNAGCREVVLKLGARGAYYLGHEEHHAPAFDIEAVDTVAAGDAFTTALALRLGQVPLVDAVRFANAAGALAAMRSGTQSAMPRLHEVEAFLRERA